MARFITKETFVNVETPFEPVGETKAFPVDVQIILATNRKLEEEVAAKRFREDLYYRVHGLQVELLPLRDARRIAASPVARQASTRFERQVTANASSALVSSRTNGESRRASSNARRAVAFQTGPMRCACSSQ